MSYPKIRKAVVAAAGLGTRLLPATKAMPKEMLPIIDTPIIQYVVEDLVSAGIEDIIIVTGWHKRNIEDHFDYPYELEKRLEESGKTEQVEQVRRIAEMANFIYIRQKGPYGNGTPFLNAAHVVGNEPFFATWGDEILYANPSRATQVIAAYQKYGKASIACLRMSEDIAYTRYGFVEIGEDMGDGVFKIKKVIEKPGKADTPSNLATLGAYILPPRIFKLLETQAPGKGGEIWLPDAIDRLSKEEDVLAVEIKNAAYYDTGNKMDYLKTMVRHGLVHEETKAEFTEFLKNLKI
ncbi:MAG TPA: UTP--glucose-1-phosphate uridylyltransferase [Patescibacteria group bacterium]|nr:UTP--glucose-1-phosphate uridylyltransferase [Patescibacteria group bacterium]